MNILVTGVAGFIGFHLTKELAARGHKVTGIDNINSYYDVELKKGRLKELEAIDGVEFIKCDLTDIDLLTKIFRCNTFDIVCNLAAQAGVRYSFENPDAYIQSNIVGFSNIIQLGKLFSVKHFVYASSSSVYGNTTSVPFKESDRVDEPQSIYAATKKSNELIAHVYSSQMDMPTTGLRFFTVYGPWGRPDMAPFLFMKSILEGKSIKVFNHGDLSRDFSYISDIVTGIVKVIEKNIDDKNSYKIYNIGNSSPVRLMDFIETIERVTGKQAIKEFVGMQQGDVYTTYADTSSIEHDFGFKPDTPLEKGISEFYEWYKSFYR